MPKPFPAEFCRDLVAVARTHEAPISQIAIDVPGSGLNSMTALVKATGSPRPRRRLQRLLR